MCGRARATLAPQAVAGAVALRLRGGDGSIHADPSSSPRSADEHDDGHGEDHGDGIKQIATADSGSAFENKLAAAFGSANSNIASEATAALAACGAASGAATSEATAAAAARACEFCFVNAERAAARSNMHPMQDGLVVHCGSSDRGRDGGAAAPQWSLTVEAMVWGLVPSHTGRNATPDHWKRFNARCDADWHLKLLNGGRGRGVVLLDGW